jgi:hypothetical protein
MASPTAEPAVSVAALIRPCLEKIRLNATGRRYAKLQQDTETLLEKLDVFLGVDAVGTPRAPASQPPPAVAAPAAVPAPAAAEAVGVAMEEAADGSMMVRLTLSPGRSSDPGHMPLSPSAAKAGQHPVRRAGALPDGAARGAPCCSSRPFFVRAHRMLL